MPIDILAEGSFANTQRLLQKLKQNQLKQILDKYGPIGVSALSAATPARTGETANSWTYQIKKGAGSYEIVWKNTHVVNGANIALLIQYGHGTRHGGYVPGRDYINPAMKPIFEQILADVREVVKA